MNRLRTILRTSAALVGLALLAAAPAAADQVILDDLIVDGSICAGLDCVNGESFGFDTLRLKENNLRIRFFDTSSTASFPTRDWQITANDSSNGGQEKFSIDDIDGGRTPFTIEAGAPSHSLYVDDGGRIGFGTSTPVAELHVKDGDTPTLRLEQDGTSGFTPQTWDVAGNEAGYFVRDATNGSTLPFRIRPGAASSSIDVAASNNVGINTSSPAAALHVQRSNGTAQILVEETSSTVSGRVLLKISNNGPPRLRFENTAVGDSNPWNVAVDGLESFNIDKPGASNPGVELSLDGSGNLTILGQCAEGAQPGSCADYVFEPGYEYLSLKELESFIRENKHLPNVPSTEEIRRDGVNVQHFQGRLLEKIEELVLYTLEQQKTIDELRTRLDALEEGGRAQ